MLTSGNLQIQSGSLNPGNLSQNNVNLTSGGLSGPTTYISVEYDPVFNASPAATITQEDIDRWNEEQDMSYYALKSELTSYALKTDLNSYVSDSELSQILNSYATHQYVTESINSAIEGLDIDIDLSAYVTYTYLESKHYLTEHQSLDGYVTDGDLSTILSTYATKNYVDNAILNAEIGGGDVTINLDEYMRKDEFPSYLLGYVTKNELSAQSYITQTQLSANGYISSIPSEYITQQELSANGYVTQYQLDQAGYLTSHQDLSDYATKAYVVDYVSTHGGGGSQDLSNYVTYDFLSSQAYLTSVPNNYPTYAAISNMSYATQSYVMDKINGIEPVSYETTYETVTYQNISIWQGTLAQYNALSNHTTYQLYLIAAE